MEGINFMNNNDMFYGENRYSSLQREVTEQDIAVYVAKVMGWMFLGLLTTAASAMFALSSRVVYNLVYGTQYGFMGIIILQFVVVLAMSGLINKISAFVATVLFLLYSAITGVTLSVFVLVYQMGSIITAFAGTAVIFFLFAVVGYTTKKDLSKIGRLAIFALLAAIVVSFINMLVFKNAGLELVISLVIVVIFTALIAYDIQKIKNIYVNARSQGLSAEDDTVRKLAIFGALSLYLDFINIFIRLLSIFGKRR